MWVVFGFQKLNLPSARSASLRNSSIFICPILYAHAFNKKQQFYPPVNEMINMLLYDELTAKSQLVTCLDAMLVQSVVNIADEMNKPVGNE